MAPTLWWPENIWTEDGWWGIWPEKKGGEEKEKFWKLDLEFPDPKFWSWSCSFSHDPSVARVVLVWGALAWFKADSVTVFCQDAPRNCYWLAVASIPARCRHMWSPPAGARSSGREFKSLFHRIHPKVRKQNADILDVGGGSGNGRVAV